MTVETELSTLEENMWTANRAGDGHFYDTRLRADAMVVSRYGVLGKAEIVPGIQRNHNPYLRNKLSDQRVVRISADSALITYRADVTALVDGEEVDFAVLATSVYAREGGGWLCVFHQQSAL
jgi:ketosteroid isomerase-like protein